MIVLLYEGRDMRLCFYLKNVGMARGNSQTAHHLMTGPSVLDLAAANRTAEAEIME